MRKNLLTSAAILGGMLLSGGAYAQSVTSPALLGGASAPNGADNFPSPGTVTVRFGGVFEWFAAATSDSADRSTRFGPGGIGAAPSAAKEASYSFGDYIRLYPTVDGVAANGLRYGVYSELRVETGIATGGGANAGISPTDRSSSLYVRRAYGYLGLANLGYIRAGTGDGVGGLFDTGTFQNFDAGGWNGDIPNLINGNAQVTFPFEGGVGAFYATDKITYLSPQVYGLEFGISYEPNTSNITDYNSGNATSNSLRLDSSANPADAKRRRNWINPEFRYRNTIGPVGVALEAGYSKSAAVGYNALASSSVQRYKGFDFGNFGIVLTYGGLSVGGHVMEGAFNGQGNLAPQGTKDAFAYIAGLSYTVGPVILGASFFQYNFAGNSGSTPLAQGNATFAAIGQERDRGVAAGITYTVTPGVSLFASYVYGDKKENGYDLINGAQSARGSQQGNTTRAQALGTGFAIRW